MGASDGPPPLPLEQYQLIIESSPVMIWRSGVDARCDYFNETWLRFRGRTMQQERGDGWAEGIHADDVARCLAIYRDHFERRESFAMEYRLRRHDGVHRWILDRGIPFRDGAGGFAGFIGSCTDVHERVEADAARGRFLGVVARELALPLNGLSVLAAWLQRDLKSGAVIDEQLLERLVLRVQRLDGLVAEFSDAARFEQGLARPVELTEVDLAPLVRKVVGAFRQVMAFSTEGKVKHVFQVEAGPSSYGAIADARAVEQMLNHLLQNAVSYAPDGGPVVVTLRADAAEMHLSVADRGIGIPAAEISAVTRRYYRASNAPPPELAGLGLGLSIVRDLSRLQHGRLSIESTLGQGTTVVISLPALDAAKPQGGA